MLVLGKDKVCTFGTMHGFRHPLRILDKETGKNDGIGYYMSQKQTSLGDKLLDFKVYLSLQFVLYKIGIGILSE